MENYDEDEARKAAKLKALLDSETAISDFKFISGDPRGRRFLRKLLEQSGIYRSSFATDQTIYFLEGERNAGLKLLNEFQRISPNEYILMLQEHLTNDRPSI